MKTLFELGNPFRRYNVTEFLNGYGLVVHPLFREHNLALEILKARWFTDFYKKKKKKNSEKL